jgi:hypothetical protein
MKRVIKLFLEVRLGRIPSTRWHVNRSSRDGSFSARNFALRHLLSTHLYIGFIIGCPEWDEFSRHKGGSELTGIQYDADL